MVTYEIYFYASWNLELEDSSDTFRAEILNISIQFYFEIHFILIINIEIIVPLAPIKSYLTWNPKALNEQGNAPTGRISFHEISIRLQGLLKG